jgi:hypothetical protein
MQHVFATPSDTQPPPILPPRRPEEKKAPRKKIFPAPVFVFKRPCLVFFPICFNHPQCPTTILAAPQSPVRPFQHKLTQEKNKFNLLFFAKSASQPAE